MLIEIMGGLAMGVFGLWQTANFLSDHEAQLTVSNTPRPSLPKPPKPKPAEPSTDVLKLVFELIRSDEGWTLKSYENTASRDYSWVHETGARLTTSYYKKSGRKVSAVSILDEKGVYQDVELNADDRLLLQAELDAYTTRATDRRQRELARSLAKRIVGGPVPALLGGADVPRLPPASDDDSEQHGAATTGLLSYDPTTKRIVASVRGDNVQLELDASLRDRYSISKKAGKSDYSDLMMRIMRENDLSEYNDMWEVK